MNRLRTPTQWLLIAGAALMLTGCFETSSGLVNKIVADARKSATPGDAWERILKGDAELTDFCAGDSMFSCRDARHELYEAEVIFRSAAAQTHHPLALRRLYQSSGDADVQREMAPYVLNEAKTTEDRHILFAAAEILGNGRYVIRDTQLQIDYLAKAWTLGDRAAPGVLAITMHSLGDPANAYLWSLRCTEGCSRQGQTDLAQLEKPLAAKDILAIQKQAQDKTQLFVAIANRHADADKKPVANRKSG